MKKKAKQEVVLNFKAPATMPTWSLNALANQKINLMLFHLHSSLTKGKNVADYTKSFTDFMNSYETSCKAGNKTAEILSSPDVSDDLLTYLLELGAPAGVEVMELWETLTTEVNQ